MSSLIHARPKADLLTLTVLAAKTLTKNWVNSRGQRARECLLVFNRDRMILRNSVLPLASSRPRLVAGQFEAEKSSKRMRDMQIVQEFRSKLKAADDLVSKLAFNLREIQDFWGRPKTNSSQESEFGSGFGSGSGNDSAKVIKTKKFRRSRK